MNEQKGECQCEHSHEDTDSRPTNTQSFELLEYLNGSVNDGLSNIKKLSINQSIDLNTPPDVSGRIHESNGNSKNEYYTYLNNYNSSYNTNLANAPWKRQPYYFRTVNTSLLAMLKMSMHAISGGSIEIMGMLVGYHKGNEIVVLDCYPLPVQGTESRVNPQNDSYEFMLSYITKLQESGLKKENIIGWYHSHPGFGCWLSGIDVQTQKLHQGFEDPYVAIVVDPIKSIKDGMIDIGAFRTLYDEHKKVENLNVNKSDLGWYSEEYYALDVKVFVNEHDRAILNKFKGMKSYSSLVSNRDQSEIDEELGNSKDNEMNNFNDPDYESIKIWKRVNTVLHEISLNHLKTSLPNKHDDMISSLISVESGDADIKLSHSSHSSTHHDNHKHSSFAESLNMTSAENGVQSEFLKESDLTRLNLGKLGVEMDMVSADEIKHLLVKDIQHGLFE